MRGVISTLVASVALTATAGSARAEAPAACANIVPKAVDARSKRLIEAHDLLGLRDIGYMHLVSGKQLLSVSPDRKSAAFVVHQADVDSNLYCVALMLVDLTGRIPARILDLGDELITPPVSIRNMEVDYGYPAVIVPQWSPDGSHLAYLKKMGGLAQVLVLNPDKGGAATVTASDVGVDDFHWSEDGASILYSDRPEVLATRAGIEAEGANGYLFDDRIMPYAGSRPGITTPRADRRRAVELASGRIRELTASEAASANIARKAPGDTSGIDIRAASGWKLVKHQAVPGSYTSPTRLIATTPEGKSIECDDEVCRGNLIRDIEGAWETDHAGEFAFLKREGWSGSRLGLYMWKVGGRPRRLASTTDLLVGCEGLGTRLLCARETSLKPRHLVTYDLRHGARRALFYDPNPEFSGLELGKATRLEWRNANGQESYGDLVLPPDAKQNDNLPLVIVQYVARGFQRGGIGDEVPIQLLAKNGFAVLSLQKPSALFAIEQSDGSIDDVSRLTSKDWADRKNIHSSLVTGIDAAIRQAPIDRNRIGISGVSDGSTTAQYALINSPGLFKAVSIGSCCVDPTAMMIYAGPGVAGERRKWGFPPAMGPGSEAWQPLALSMNPPDRLAPMLMQLADSELVISLETIAAYENAGRPIEARIFPDEYHLKIQPQHRLAVYRRNLQWFDFWLNGIEQADPIDPAQYSRWRAMRDRPTSDAK